MRFTSLVLAAAVSLSATGCTRAQEDPAFDAKVHAYLLSHPEVIEEAITKLQQNREAEADLKVKAALKQLRPALEQDPRDYVANPKGAITVTEFYDYRCPHCINAAPAVLAIIKDNPDIRFVFKEMPIFGAISEHAARAAIAVKANGGDYVGLHKAFMATKGLNDAAIDDIARRYGVDLAAIELPARRDRADAQIADIHKLAGQLSIDGTPTFIVGDTVVPGEDMEALKAAITAARAGARARRA